MMLRLYVVGTVQVGVEPLVVRFDGSVELLRSKSAWSAPDFDSVPSNALASPIFTPIAPTEVPLVAPDR